MMINLSNFNKEKATLIIKASSTSSGGYSLTRLLAARQQLDEPLKVVIVGQSADKVAGTLDKEIAILNKFTEHDYTAEFKISKRCL
ncbi:hypothetical protein [Vibrio coralliilyticus]|uniref:hypothetical protein n=1 Tax=Vibrio coralliilyticus TaxID=190893 RepID=UPI00148C45FB|nr:hypothetical protein [Vibrio coralliilyticus]NOI30198.1 hypothetical protein [Vibrio coralliilyticus]NOI46828.1 hypothetical protein [Vibrio coralliilyticus]